MAHLLSTGESFRTQVGLRTSKVIVYVPDVAAERVGCPLQRPREKRQLAPETALLETQTLCQSGGVGLEAIRAQHPQVVEQGTQSVVALAQEDVAEWGVRRRHVLGQAVELHLHEKVRAGTDAGVSVAEGFNHPSGTCFAEDVSCTLNISHVCMYVC